MQQSRPDTPRPIARLIGISAVLATLGVVVASYLTVVHYRDDLLVCGVTGGCHTVQQSEYALLFGIPVAILGLAMYLTVLALCGLRRWKPDLVESATMASFAISLAAVVYAGYLTYVELFVIDAICQWCVASAVLTSAICLIEGIALWRLMDVSEQA